VSCRYTFTHNAAISNFCVTKDSRFLISGDSTGTIYLWDVFAGKKIKEFEGDPTLSVRNIDINANDEMVSFVFSGRQKKSKSYVETYKIYDLFTTSDTEGLKKVIDSKVESSETKFVSAKFSDLNKKMFVSKEDGSMEIYNVNEDKPFLTKKIHDDTILDFDLSVGQEALITASKDGKSNIVNVENLEIINSFAPEKPTRNLNACKFSPLFSLKDDKNKFHSIIAGGQESKDVTTTHKNAGGFEVLFYNTLCREPVGSVDGHFGPVNSLGFSGNGKCFASGGEDSTVRIYHLTDDFISNN